jgi:type III secretion protein Q
MKQFSDWLEIDSARPVAEQAPFGGMMINVIAEAASINISLTQIATLRPGDIVDSPAQSDGLVTLRAAGRPIARGTLLDIDGRLAVRIEHLI